MSSPLYQNLPIQQIQLDTTNPRIRRFLESYQGDSPTPEQIFLALGAGGDESEGAGPSFEKLKNSIFTNGGIIHPIIVRKVGKGYVCVEGNTRLALYSSFVKEGLPGNWKKIPALVHSKLTETQIDAIRLQIHLVGTRQWDPYSKAKYLHFLRTQEHMPFEMIVDYCGGRQSEVTEFISAYSDMETFYRPILPDDGAFDATRFSGFVELQKSGIKNAIATAGFDLIDFSRWIQEERLYPLNLVRKLPAILQNEKAREIFLKEDAKAAVRTLDVPDLKKTLAEANISQLAQTLTQALYKVGWLEGKQITSSQQSETSEALFELQSVINDFLKTSNESD
jgi:hypothetical protein